MNDRPTHSEDVIEVTPEMISAGCEELDSGTAQEIFEGFISPVEVVIAVYRAMWLSRPQT